MHLKTGLYLGLVALLVALPQAQAKKRTPGLKADLQALIAAAQDNRSPGSPGNRRALEWLKTQAASISGWQIELHEFTPDIDFAVQNYKTDLETYLKQAPGDTPQAAYNRKMTDVLIKYEQSLRGKKGTNLILRKKGTNAARANELVVVSAHFDTITGTVFGEPAITPEAKAPGANDNGIAVAALLELARKLKSFKPGVTLELVFFDFEEAFFLGSYAYGKELNAKGKLAKMINLEMIGRDQPYKRRVSVFTRSAGSPHLKGDLAIAQALEPELKRQGLRPEIVRNNFDRSDQWSFWQTFHHGVTVSQNWEENFSRNQYHQAADDIDKICWEFAEKITAATEAAIKVISR